MKVMNLSLCAALLASTAAYAQAPAAPPPAPTNAGFIVHAKDAPVMPVALWTENGKPMAARGADAVKTAPKDATMLSVKVFALGGPNFRQVTIEKGASFVPPAGPTDSLVHVLKGKMKVKLGELQGEVGAGDSFRKMSGQANHYDAIEEVVMVETDYAPPGMGGPPGAPPPGAPGTPPGPPPGAAPPPPPGGAMMKK